MKQREITEFLKQLQNRRISSKLINGWVSMPCPLAPWTHRNSQDKNPSFGVKVQATGDRVSIFNCYTCKKRGPMSYLAQLYQDFSGQDKSHLIDEAEDIELFGVQLPLWDERKDAEPHMIAPLPLGAEYEDIFEPAWADMGEGAMAGVRADQPQYMFRNGTGWVHGYLLTRGVTYSAAKEMGLCVDADDGHGAERIIFPVRGRQGELYGYTGRAVDPEVNPRIRDYYGLPKRACLLGLDAFINDTASAVILCEGLFDYARLTECEHMAVAAMHSGLTELQARLLRDLGLPVILMYDNDEAGRSGAKLAKKLLQDYVPLQKVRYPDGRKDPGSLSRMQVDRMLRDSRVA